MAIIIMMIQRVGVAVSIIMTSLMTVPKWENGPM